VLELLRLPELLLMVTRADAEATTVPTHASHNEKMRIHPRIKGATRAKLGGHLLFIVWGGQRTASTRSQAALAVDQNGRIYLQISAGSGSPAWIRTKTNRVRICCATVTLRDYVGPTQPSEWQPPQDSNLERRNQNP
jgi:hypothetical protein